LGDFTPSGAVSALAYEPQSRERHTLIRKHAHGGLGQVWLARDGDMDLLRPRTDFQQFLQELDRATHEE
jgi:hypothetical protein